MLIVDVDNHDGELSADDVIRMKRAGIEGAIVGLQYPNPSLYPKGVAHQQIPMLLAGGIKLVGCYAESQHISAVWDNVAHLKPWIPQIYQACEESHVDWYWINTSLDFIDNLNLPMRGGIYTGAWWWQGKPFEHWFGDRDLWVAQYDENYDVDTFTGLGDWTQCKVKQVTGTAKVGRLEIDLNVMR